MVRYGFRIALEVVVAAFVFNAYLVQSLQTDVSAATVQTVSQTKKFEVAANLPDINTIYAQVNRIRVESGLLPLQRNVQLTQLANQRALDMKSHTYYAHRGPDGRDFSDVAVSTGYSFDYGCENLVLEFTTMSDRYIQSWMNSRAGHKECLLNQNVTEAGYAVTEIASVAGVGLPTYVVVAIHSTKTMQATK